MMFVRRGADKSRCEQGIVCEKSRMKSLFLLLICDFWGTTWIIYFRNLNVQIAMEQVENIRKETSSKITYCVTKDENENKKPPDLSEEEEESL